MTNDPVQRNSVGRADDHLVEPERAPHGDEHRDSDEEAEQHIWRSVN
ncbi:hypothetical protein [Streptomyces sp. H51]|nr:hypothetical protein [Streptomyces sp. H51]